MYIPLQSECSHLYYAITHN
uniref:Uncharacterized protein n=1 Tax=Arundo donax TaxID=35708 RepID=A0A0A9BML3_ARUDO